MPRKRKSTSLLGNLILFPFKFIGGIFSFLDKAAKDFRKGKGKGRKY